MFSCKKLIFALISRGFIMDLTMTSQIGRRWVSISCFTVDRNPYSTKHWSPQNGPGKPQTTDHLGFEWHAAIILRHSIVKLDLWTRWQLWYGTNRHSAWNEHWTIFRNITYFTTKTWWNFWLTKQTLRNIMKNDETFVWMLNSQDIIHELQISENYRTPNSGLFRNWRSSLLCII